MNSVHLRLVACLSHSCLRASPLFYIIHHGKWFERQGTEKRGGRDVGYWMVAHGVCRVRELRRLEFAESTERDMVLLCVRLWRRLRSPSTARRVCHPRWSPSYACAFCGKNTVKRSCVGIWECKKCGKVVAGGAWTVATPAAMTVRSSIQRLRRSKVEA